MARSQKLARPADQQVLPRDLESVGVLEDHLEPQFGDFAHRLFEQQQTRGLGRTPPDAAAQLMQLRKPEALGVFDHHQRCIGHIDAHFNHRRGHQHIDVARRERRHGRGFFVGLHPAVQQPYPKLRHGRRQFGMQRHGSLQFEFL